MTESAVRPLGSPRMVIGEAQATNETRKWTAIGFVVLGLTVGVATVWSTLAPLSSAVVAVGAIQVDSNRKKIQHIEGGFVKEIVVQDGSVVKAGDVLVRLDETRAGAAHGVVTGGRDIALATQARLEAERDDKAAIQFPRDLLGRTSVPQVDQIMKAQVALFAARRSARTGELGILDQQIRALQSEIAGYESQQTSKKEQLASLEADLKSLRELDTAGMVEKTKLRSVERELARIRGERDELASKVLTARTGISEKELKKFQVRKAFQEEIAAELKKVQAESFELLERESSTKRTLELTELRAPVAGTVTGLRVHTAGGVIGAGEVLMELVPSADRLMVEARVTPGDIDRVVLGQSAGVKLHAFHQRSTPELNGTVSYVSADAAVDPRTELTYFVVRLDVPADELTRLGGNKVQPGMQADVFIRTGSRTFFSYLMEPLTDSFRKAWLER